MTTVDLHCPTPEGTVIYHGPAHTKEWFAARSGGVTASEIAAICGMSPWESRFSLYHRKAGTIPPQPETQRMTAGLMLEGVVREWFAKETSRPITATDIVLANRDRPWQKASPDALTADGPIEAKTSVTKDDWGKPGTDEVPPYYRMQTMWQMDTTGHRQAFIPVLFGDFSFQWYVIDYDEADAIQLRTAARLFLDDLEGGVLPDIDGHAATYLAVRNLHPDIDPDARCELDGELAERFRAAKFGLRNAEIEDRTASGLVLSAMGDARRAYANEEYIARREAKAGGTPYLKSAIKLDAKTAVQAA